MNSYQPKSESSQQSVRLKGEQGIALMVAMFALLVLTLIGLAMLTRATTEVLINDNFKRSKTSYFTAEAGTEEARFRLTPTAAGNRIDTAFSDLTASTGVVYIRGNVSIDPTNQSASNRFRDTEYLNIATRNASGTQSSVTSTTYGQTPTYYTSIMTGTVPYAWIKVTRKTETLAGQNVDADGANQNTSVYYGPTLVTGVVSQYVKDAASALTRDQTQSNPVYLLTAMSVDGTGAQRKIQTEVVVPPPIKANGAVDSYEDVNFMGNLDISGNDECHPGNPSYAVYGVTSDGTIDNPNPSQDITGRNAPSPALPGSPSLCPTCGWNWDIPTMITQYKKNPLFKPITDAATGVNCSGSPVSCSGSNVNLGTAPNVPPPGTPTNTPVPGYYYSPGNLNLTSANSSGYGILIVDGDVTVNGGLYFEGIIIAKGSFNFIGGGGTAINIRGAVIAGDSLTDTTSDFGGTVDIQYNSCSIANIFTQMPMTVLTFKDRALY